MQKTVKEILSLCLLISGLFLLNFSVKGQDTLSISPPLPDNINNIIMISCVPCHTNTGGYMSRSKLNFNIWTQYSAETQKEKAEGMSSKLIKGSMPPKTARENRPEIIPTDEQIKIIKTWSESFKTDTIPL